MVATTGSIRMALMTDGAAEEEVLEDQDGGCSRTTKDGQVYHQQQHGLILRINL